MITFGGMSDWTFEAWRKCSHCEGTKVERPGPGEESHAEPRKCTWCKEHRHRGYEREPVLLTLAQLAEALKTA
jgi:hypothetical protein